MRKAILESMILSLFLSSCSFWGESLQGHHGRKLANELDIGDFALNLCMPLEKEKKVTRECEEGEYVFGSEVKQGCGNPWPVIVRGQRPDKKLVVSPVAGGPNNSYLEKIPVEMDCLTSIIGMQKEIEFWLNISPRAQPEAGRYVFMDLETSGQMTLCGLSPGTGLGLFSEFPHPCNGGHLKVRSFKGLALSLSGSKHKSESIGFQTTCSQMRTEGEYQIFEGEFFSRVKTKLGCLNADGQKISVIWQSRDA